MPPLDIVTVRNKKDFDAFLDLPKRIYADFPLWVPPLRSEEKELLTPGKHPFWDHSDRELFLALRDGRPVGRIAAIEDRNANQYQKARMCVWGFFECDDDIESAKALVDAAARWGQNRGLTFLRGPMNPSPNYVIGMLLEGFEHSPAIMMPWTPPYYIDLMYACGMEKEKDLLAFYFDRKTPIPEWAVSLSRRLTDRGEVTIRSGKMSRLKEEIHLLMEIYNDCWKNNWGFVPMTEAEAARTAKELKLILQGEMVFFLYHGDFPVACGLILPDFNPVLRRFKGKIGLNSLINLLLYRREITGCRGLLFGVREEYKKLGIPLVAFDYVLNLTDNHRQYSWMEMSWNLEDNRDINELLEDFGGKPYKKYRLWRWEI